jgi:tripartite-type tricarboxylate transporter receptor subunit TctC
VDDLKKANKTIMLGANAVGSLPYIAALSFMHQAGIKAEAVPMSGGAPSIAALLGKQVDVGAFHPNEAVQHVGSGDLKYLCVASPERMKDFPDVPTSAELGVNLDYSVWKWLQTPKGVDPKILAFLEEKLKDMKADPKFQEFAKNTKLEIIDIPGKEVEKRLRSQAAATSEAIHNIGIK